MTGVRALSVAKKRPITVEEYRKLKQRNLALRRQYVKMLQNPAKRNKPEYAKRISKLEKRIAELELRLAYSELILPEPEHMTLGDMLGYIGHLAKNIWHSVASSGPVKKLTARY